MSEDKEIKYRKIVKKVKGLIAISKDQKNDEESQSAFILAQKLMIQYNINKNDIEDYETESENIGETSVTIYKRVYWWEKELASIIASNFRVKYYTNSKKFQSYSHKKTKIVFYGLDKDLELAKEMYLLAYEVVLFHSKTYVENHYSTYKILRERYYTESVKSSYIRGFLEGLNTQFREQVSVLKQEFELIVMIPKEVEESYKEYSKDFGSFSIKKPPVSITAAFRNGLSDGNKIDFTKSKIYTDYSSLINKCIIFTQGGTQDLLAKITSISSDTIEMFVVNTTSQGASKSSPIVYKWSLPVTYDFEFLNKEDSDFVLKTINNNLKNI